MEVSSYHGSRGRHPLNVGLKRSFLIKLVVRTGSGDLGDAAIDLTLCLLSPIVVGLWRNSTYCFIFICLEGSGTLHCEVS